MRLEKRQWVHIFLSLFAVSIFCWQNMHQSELPEVHLIPKKGPDQQFHNLLVKEFDASGQLVHTLVSPYVMHLPETNQYHVSTPNIHLQNVNQSTWDITAKTATVEQNAHYLILKDDVLMQSAATSTHPASIIKTEFIQYSPKKKWVTTPQKIIWQQAQNQIESIGMNGFLEEGRIELLSHAKAIYDPKTS